MYKKPNILLYRIAQFVAFIFATLIFKRQILRNEIKNTKRPFVVIANHECALDFVNLIGLSKRPMTFVISHSFYSTLPLKRFFDGLGVIAKQQFQTTTANLKAMKAVVNSGNPLVIYPAGLMCEDGLSTPIPQGTYKFLKWLGVDVYVAKITGSYFVMPKWSSGFNPGKTLIDVYKILSKEDLESMEVSEIKSIVRKELLFNAYKDQERLKLAYKRKGEISGLKDVLYICPNCGEEFTIYEKDKNMLACTSCGYGLRSDSLYMLTRACDFGPEIKYVSDWNKAILERVKNNLLEGIDNRLESPTDIYQINPKKHKFERVGSGMVCLDQEKIEIKGTFHDKEGTISVDTLSYPTLPFKPGKYLEIQKGNDIYRLRLKDGKRVIKFINTIKMLYLIHHDIHDEPE